MRYLIRVSRVQTAERSVSAKDEESALRKIQEELEDRLFGNERGASLATAST
jgi:hypothetical protein